MRVGRSRAALMDDPAPMAHAIEHSGHRLLHEAVKGSVCNEEIDGAGNPFPLLVALVTPLDHEGELVPVKVDRGAGEVEDSLCLSDAAELDALGSIDPAQLLAGRSLPPRIRTDLPLPMGVNQAVDPCHICLNERGEIITGTPIEEKIPISPHAYTSPLISKHLLTILGTQSLRRKIWRSMT